MAYDQELDARVGYLTADDIRHSPGSISEIFADDVCRKIEERIR